jgi:hypothetical protein
MDIVEQPIEAPTKDFQDKKEPEKKLTREQRRFLERIEKGAKQTYVNLSQRFFDPEGEEVVQKMNQVCAQWRTFCARKQLNKEVYGHMERGCQALVNEYLANKESKANVDHPL